MDNTHIPVTELHTDDGVTAPGESLPLDVRTVLIAIGQRWRILLGVGIFSIIAGIGGGWLWGERLFEAETVLLFKPIEGTMVDEAAEFSLNTQLHLVKMRNNLEAVRQELALSVTLETLGAACDVQLQRNADLMTIRVQWDVPETSADIANTLREVFLRQHRYLRSTQWRRGALAALQGRLQDTQDALHAIERQKSDVAAFIEDLQYQVALEKRTTPTGNGLYALNVRTERLDKQIETDRKYRANLALLERREGELSRNKTLLQEGIISTREYEEIVLAYERQKALTIDTQQITTWKRDLDTLDSLKIRPTEPKSSTEPMLQEMMLKEFDLQLRKAALSEKLNALKEKVQSLQVVEERGQDVPPVTGPAVQGMPRQAGGQGRDGVAMVNSISDFSVVSLAVDPTIPTSSSRKLLAVLITFGIAFLGAGSVVGLTLLQPTARSSRELALKLPLPVLGALPRGVSTGKRSSTCEKAVRPVRTAPASDTARKFKIAGVRRNWRISAAASKHFAITAQNIRQRIPQKGARILLVSVEPGEGTTTIAANLSAVWGCRDERVLVVDGQVRHTGMQRRLLDLIPEKNEVTMGLGEYLSFQSDRVHDILAPTVFPGVMCLPSVSSAIAPDLLASHRMRDLMDTLSGLYSLIVIDAPPLTQYADATTLGQYADAVILVVRSQRTRIADVRAGLQRLQSSGAPVVGTILNDVEQVYMEKI